MTLITTAWARAASLLNVMLIMSAVGCASVPHHKPESPDVNVASIRLLGLSLKSQTLGLTLQVNNPNNYNLPITQLSFNALLSGELIAEGASDEQVTIPANGEALLDVTVKAGLGKLLTPLLAMSNAEAHDLGYQVVGTVKLSNWPTPIPFNVKGELENSLQHPAN